MPHNFAIGCVSASPGVHVRAQENLNIKDKETEMEEGRINQVYLSRLLYSEIHVSFQVKKCHLICNAPTFNKKYSCKLTILNSYICYSFYKIFPHI